MFKLLKFAKGKSKTLMILSIIFIFFQAILDVAQPLALMFIIQFTLKESEWMFSISAFWPLIGIMLALAIFSLGFGVLGSYWGSKSSLIISQNIRQGMFARVQALSFSDIDKVTASSLITRLTNDVQKFQITLQMVFTMLIKAPFLLIGGLVISFYSDWTMGLIMIGVIIVLGSCISIVAWKGMPLFDAMQKNVDENNKVMRENILGMRVVKTFCLENEQQKRYDVCSNNLKNNSTKAQIIFALLMPVISICFDVTISIILLVGGITAVDKNSLDFVADMYMMVNILFMVLSAVIISLMVIINVSRSRPSRIRINEILSMKTSIRNNSAAKHLDKELDIEFKNVNFKYDPKAEEYVLKNINCKFKHGQSIGIVGGTGSGKTSLISLIPRLYDLTEGSVTIGGNEVKDIDLKSLRSKVGVVIQENILFSGTIKSNLLYGKQNATINELDEACQIACADDFINSQIEKYDSVVEQRGRNFSGGQRQRISIARTIVKRPQILILDDSTSALDLATEAALQRNLKQNLTDCTTIIVAQRISAVKDCDQILVMEAGEITGQGTHEDLKKNNKIYRSIVLSQLGQEGLE